MHVHVCVSVIKGLPYEDTSHESRNTLQDLSLLSETHTHTHTHKNKTEAADGGKGESRGRRRYDSDLER